jgi:hypothetical protein
MAPTYDTSRWPIVHIELGDVRTEEQFRAHLRKLESFLSHERCVFVFDGRRSTPPSPLERRWIAAFNNEMVAKYPGRFVGVGLIAKSAVQAGIMTAVIWLMPPEIETRTFTAPDPAFEWAKQRLSRFGPFSKAPPAA